MGQTISCENDDELQACIYRSPLPVDGPDRLSECRLLAQILSLPSTQCPVTPAMCRLCSEYTGTRLFADHPLFPSLAYQRASEQLLEATTPKEQEYWEAWQERAEAALLRQCDSLPSISHPHCACDVILCVSTDSESLRESIVSILEQQEVSPILHLVETGVESIDWGELAGRWNVQIHRLPGVVSPLNAAEQIAGTLRTPYLAVQHPLCPSLPWRLALSIRTLLDQGAELFVASLVDEDSSDSHDDAPNHTLPDLVPWSLVIRRATLADLNGSWGGDHNGCGPLIQEAARQGRSMAISPRPVLDASLSKAERICGVIRRIAPPPSSVHQYRPQQITSAPVSCDVVLPFKGQLDYVREALDSLLNQQFVRPVIHLIDDATESDTTNFLNEWARHPQLRVYRNRENVGQFQSFNNVAPCWETDLVAVQDADDISLPHRLHWAVQMLQASGADYFGGAVELFGDEDLIRPVMSETTELARMRRADYRRSFYPLWSKTDYFLENPTAVFRTAMFREMGGYADFGSRLMNRTSLDTEFQLRCLYRGVRFAITREIVTRYRVHPESATQNRQTGWGTTPRAASIRQLEERCRIFRNGNFDPRLFGALGRYTHLTERWNG